MFSGDEGEGRLRVEEEVYDEDVGFRCSVDLDSSRLLVHVRIMAFCIVAYDYALSLCNVSLMYHPVQPTPHASVEAIDTVSILCLSLVHRFAS
jgi:hypothetical protein